MAICIISAIVKLIVMAVQISTRIVTERKKREMDHIFLRFIQANTSPPVYSSPISQSCICSLYNLEVSKTIPNPALPGVMAAVVVVVVVVVVVLPAVTLSLVVIFLVIFLHLKALPELMTMSPSHHNRRFLCPTAS